MPPELESLLRHLGYFAVTLGTIFEGETILFLASFAAYHGNLSILWVLVFAYIGTIAGDQFFFFLGRLKGQDFMARRPQWRERSEKVFDWVQRHRIKIILGYRFMYGFRAVTPFVLGLTRMKAKYFIIINAIVGLVWTLFISAAGFYLGSFLEGLGLGPKVLQLGIVIVIALAFMAVWLTTARKAHR